MVAASVNSSVKHVGQSLSRLEDRPLLTGRGRFAGDISFPQQLHMRVIRSNFAHGKLRAVDAHAARALPGVHAVWTAADVADIPPIDFRQCRVEGLEPYRQPLFASDRVRYVGEPVAAVFAEDSYLAEDAAELVALHIEELPAILSAHDDPGTFSEGLSTEPAIVRKGYGDTKAAISNAYTIVEGTFSIGRHSGVPIETRGAIARYDVARDVLELHGAAKLPHINRDQIARMLGRAASSVHLFESHVGGGFGIRGELYPEDVLVCAAAVRLQRPIKWIEDRREHLIAANHSRQQCHHVRAAVDRDGRILGLEDEIFFDQGAYVRTHAATVPDLTAAMLPGPYRIPAYRAAVHIRLTNKTPCGTYRAPGRFESTFARERLLDVIADKIGIDRVEIRRRNLIASKEMPYRRALDALGTEIVLDSGDYSGLLDKALSAIDWPQLREKLALRRASGELVGLGIALFVEKSGLGPSDQVRVGIDSDGAVEVISGSASVGQGMETVIAQICADTLGVDYRRVRVVHGQTDRIEHGMGTFASRVTVMTGEATRVAASELKKKTIDAASELLQMPAAALDIVGGEVVCTGSTPGPSIGLGALARTLLNSSDSHRLVAEGWFRVDHMNYPYGVHISVARVDRDTGGVAVERYLVAYDVGKAVNPMLIEGQIAGGCAQGVGGALLEEFLYDDRGEPLSVTLADYLMPTMREIPTIDVLVCEDAPSPLNPLGLKGAGEGGTTGVGAALAAAIDDALGEGGIVTELPITPQRLRRLIRRAAEGQNHTTKSELRGALVYKSKNDTPQLSSRSI
jgi:aerobic carbon-monoxide dehydrogenase large subunit